MKMRTGLKIAFIFSPLLLLTACGGKMPNGGKLEVFNTPTVEADWIRNGEVREVGCPEGLGFVRGVKGPCRRQGDPLRAWRRGHPCRVRIDDERVHAYRRIVVLAGEDSPEGVERRRLGIDRHVQGGHGGPAGLGAEPHRDRPPAVGLRRRGEREGARQRRPCDV